MNYLTKMNPYKIKGFTYVQFDDNLILNVRIFFKGGLLK